MAQKKTNNVDSVEKTEVKVEAAKTTKRNSRKSHSRVRECLKEEPLEPLYMGKIKKPKQAKRPKFSTKKSKIPKKISNVKSADQKSHPASKTSSRTSSRTSSMKTPGVKPNGRSRKEKPRLPSIVVEREVFESEVIFQPRLGCQACLAGRKGEGGNDCWSCRLARLQNIQEEKMKSLN